MHEMASRFMVIRTTRLAWVGRTHTPARAQCPAWTMLGIHLGQNSTVEKSVLSKGRCTSTKACRNPARGVLHVFLRGGKTKRCYSIHVSSWLEPSAARQGAIASLPSSLDGNSPNWSRQRRYGRGAQEQTIPFSRAWLSQMGAFSRRPRVADPFRKARAT